jgi:hypothetical protein
VAAKIAVVREKTVYFQVGEKVARVGLWLSPCCSQGALVMKSVLSLCLLAVGLAACGTGTTDSSSWFRTTADSSGWFRYDGTPVKGNAALQEQFNTAYAACYGSNKRVYRECMSARGYTEEAVPAAGAPVISPSPPAISPGPPAISPGPTVVSTASPEWWRARAAEARALAAQLADPVSKQMMIGIAETYDRLAAHQGRSTPADARRSSRP